MQNVGSLILIAAIVLISAAVFAASSGFISFDQKQECKGIDPKFCESDADCICGGTDIPTGECFVGNTNYYDKCVYKTKICPDFCTGIAGKIGTSCIKSRCVQV